MIHNSLLQFKSQPMKKTLLFSPSVSLTDSLDIYHEASSPESKKSKPVSRASLDNIQNDESFELKNEEECPKEKKYRNSTEDDSIYSEEDLSNPFKACLMKLRQEKGLKKLAIYGIDSNTKLAQSEDGITLKQSLRRKALLKYKQPEELIDTLHKK